MPVSPKKVRPEEAYAKAAKFCAYQERSRREVTTKLMQWGLSRPEAADLLDRLEKENFVNEDRFVAAYVGGKFRMQRWGRVKISYGLRGHGVGEAAVALGLAALNNADYAATLHGLAVRKAAALTAETDPQRRRQKLAAFLLSRGFESDLVWPVVNGVVG